MIAIGNYIGRKGSRSWTPQSISSKVLFWGRVSEISGGQMPNKLGTDYITVSGSPATYVTPDNASYINADTDYIWFYSDGIEREGGTTTAELIGYDVARTFVKYLDASPYTIEEIMILKAGQSLTADELIYCYGYFHLPIFWSGVWSDYGYIKGNRPLLQKYSWTANVIPTIISASVENTDKDAVVIIASANLDTGSVPATSAFTIAGKTINSVSIATNQITLVLSAELAYGENVTVSYTKPATNYLKADNGKAQVASFSNLAVSNNIQVVPDYANTGGTGDRRATIAATTNMTVGASAGTGFNGIIDGSDDSFTNYLRTSTEAASGKYMLFDFGSGARKVINEATYIQWAVGTNLGTWKWQVSNDESTSPTNFTDIGNSFTLGNIKPQVITELSGNTTGYRHYRLLGVSGTLVGNNYPMEIKFKIG